MADDEEVSPDPAPEPKISRVPQKVSRSTSPLIPIALVIALIAVGLAVWALVSRPEESAPASAGGGGDGGAGVVLPGDAKTRVCDAAQSVAVAVQLQTNANIGPEPAAVEAVAANARLAMLGGGDYLLSQIDSKTPADIADTARAFGNTLRLIGINALAGLPNSDPEQSGRIQDAETNRNKLGQLCTQ